MPLIAGAVIGGIGAITKGITGLSQMSKAKKLEKNNPRPTFDIQQEYLNNQGLAENLAQEGLGDKAMDYYTTESGRGLTSGEDTALQLGGGANSISGLYDNYNRNLQSVSVADSAARTKNIQYLMGVNKELAAQKVQQWVLNKYEPFKDRAKAAAGARAAGQANIQGAISDATGAVSAYATGTQNKDLNDAKIDALNSGTRTLDNTLAPDQSSINQIINEPASPRNTTYSYTDKTGNHNNIDLASLYKQLYGDPADDNAPGGSYTPSGAWDYE